MAQAFYARKHNPAISFTGISGSQARCSDITELHPLGSRRGEL